jgi:hypothetical protein
MDRPVQKLDAKSWLGSTVNLQLALSQYCLL